MSACSLCGGGSSTILFTAKDYEYGVPGEWSLLHCSSCGLLFQEPLPDPAEISRFYPASYSAYNEDGLMGWLFRVVYARDARRIAAMVNTGARILDVGCGNGSMLLALRRLGNFQLHGVEIDATAAQRARDRGFDVSTGELAEAGFSSNSFDLIRLGHIIEHARDPMATIRGVHTLLRPGGLLFGETPNTDCVDFRLLGRYWGALHVPRHIVLFDDRNLRDALRQAGFHDIKISWGLRTVGWSAGIQNLLADRFGLKVPPNGRVSWYGLLIALFLPITLAQALTHKTATMMFTARKAAL